jgi:hypothetical protein
LVFSLIVSNEEHLRALVDTGASSIITLEAYTSDPLIKTDESNTTTWNKIQWVVSLLKLKLKYACDIFIPRVQSQETNFYFLGIHVDDRSESSSTYDMIIGNGPRSPWRIRHNHELQ